MVPPLDDPFRTPLENILINRISVEGPIPFSELMKNCLYHPEFGYYMTGRQRIGRCGDFFTSSSVSTIFGQLIAVQLAQMWTLLGEPNDFIIAEQGAGEGHLALDILNSLKRDFSAFYATVSYSIIEISPDAHSRQIQLLDHHKEHVRWCCHSDLKGMVGCFLSNELVDAFPVHLVEMKNSQLLEVFVDSVNGLLQETLQVPSSDDLSNYLGWISSEIVEGNRAEINLEAPIWMDNVAKLLHRGFVLTIDYGYLSQEFYAPWRTSGTLMCYYQHTTSENPYARIGEQDLTAHVNFSALIKAGEEAGLKKIFYGDQCKFLLGLGFVDALIAAQTSEKDPRRAQALRLTLKNLILPDGGMGEIFKVLIQSKGVESQELLCSRSLRDIPIPLPGN